MLYVIWGTGQIRVKLHDDECQTNLTNIDFLQSIKQVNCKIVCKIGIYDYIMFLNILKIYWPVLFFLIFVDIRDKAQWSNKRIFKKLGFCYVHMDQGPNPKKNKVKISFLPITFDWNDYFQKGFTIFLRIKFSTKWYITWLCYDEWSILCFFTKIARVYYKENFGL